MKLWLLTQDINAGYDTHDSVVVAAETEDDARLITPDQCWLSEKPFKGFAGCTMTSWANTPDQVSVKFLGDAAPGIERGIVLASFNAG